MISQFVYGSTTKIFSYSLKSLLSLFYCPIDKINISTKYGGINKVSLIYTCYDITPHYLLMTPG